MSDKFMRFLTLAVLCGVMMSGNLSAENIPTAPDLPALQSRVATLVGQEWLKWCGSWLTPRDLERIKIQQVDIRMLRRADSLLTNIPLRLDKVNPLKDDPVYLISAVADTGFWKTTTEHVLVLQHRTNEWKTLFHFIGGMHGRGMDMQLVDLGVSSFRQAILIEDYASGNQQSQTRTIIYRYDPGQARMIEIFNQLTTWLPSVLPLVYKSTLSFEKSPSELKDIVVHTDYFRQNDDESKPEPPATSVFSWDGKSYVGKMKKPVGAPD